MKDMQVKDLNGSNHNCRFTDPDTCPLCHRSCVPRLIDALHFKGSHVDQISVIYLCPSRDCHSHFIAKYVDQYRHGNYVLYSTAPNTPNNRQFEEEIRSVSPLFCEIYSQAETALQLKLNSVAGPAFRKALEFLVKDFLQSTAKDDAARNRITQLTLGNAMDELLEKYETFKIIGERAVWLGNDQAHYQQKWPEKDIRDFIEAINAVVHGIEINAYADKASKEMPGKDTKTKARSTK